MSLLYFYDEGLDQERSDGDSGVLHDSFLIQERELHFRYASRLVRKNLPDVHALDGSALVREGSEIEKSHQHIDPLFVALHDLEESDGISNGNFFVEYITCHVKRWIFGGMAEESGE